MITSRAGQFIRAIQSPEKLFIFLLLLLSVLIRLINLDSPLFTGNPFRQTMTAMTVWMFVDEGISLVGYQTPVFGPPWTIPFEFPIYQLTAAIIAKLGIENIDMAGRIAAILYFYLSAWFLFLVCQKYLGTIAATCILLVYVWSPFTIVWSRNFMIDYASVAFSLGYFYFFARWLDESRRPLPFVVSLAFGVMAFLVKVTTVPTVLLPMAYVALKRMWPALRQKQYQLRPILKERRTFLAGLAAMVLVPTIPFLSWLQYSDAVKASSEFSEALTSASLSEWNFGTWEQKMTIGNWVKIARWIVRDLVTWPVLTIAIVGLPAYFRGSKKGGDLVAIVAGAAAITVALFFNLYWVHDYYLMGISASVSIVMGFCVYLVLTKVLDDDFRLGKWCYVAVLIIAAVLYVRREYVTWALEVSYDDPNLTLSLAKTIRDNTAENEYVIVADVFDWDPQYLYYARRKGFMLWFHEGDKAYQFFKKHNFTTVVHAEPHERLFACWKYRKLVGICERFKVVRVSDTPIE